MTHKRAASAHGGEGEEEELREEAYMVKIVGGSERLGQVCACVSECLCLSVCLSIYICIYM